MEHYLIGILAFAPKGRIEGPQTRLDLVGAISCALGLLGIVYGVIQANSAGWLSPQVWVPLLVGSGILWFFSRWELRTPAPLLNLTLFGNRTISIVIIVGMLGALVMGGVFLPLIYFLQLIQGNSPVGAMVKLMPLMLVAAAMSPVAGALTKKIGGRAVITGGFILITLGSSVFMFVTPATPYALMLVGLLLLGAGNICVATPVADIILSAVPAERSGGAAALNSSTTQIGGALGLAVITGVFLARAKASFVAHMAQTGLSTVQILDAARIWQDEIRNQVATNARALPESFYGSLKEAARFGFAGGIGSAFAIAAATCLFCAALVWFGIKERQAPAQRGATLVGS